MKKTTGIILIVLLLLPAAGCEGAKGEKKTGEKVFPAGGGAAVPSASDSLQEVTLERLGDEATLLKPEVLVELPWGSGGWMAGRADGVEAISLGPMSFALSPSGELYILDQENGRILTFAADGSRLREISLPGTTFWDLQVGTDGAVVLLDRLVRSSLLVIGGMGDIAGEYDVVGEGIPEGGGITAMFLQPDGVWLEFEHARSVRVLDRSLKPCPRTVLSGRPTLLAGSVRAGAALRQLGGVKLWLEGPGAGGALAERSFAFNHTVARIIWVGSDAAGRIYGIFHVLEREPDLWNTVTHEEVAGLVLDESLNVLAALRSPHVLKRWYQFKEFDIAPDGSVLQMAFEDDRLTILRWRVP